MLSMEVRTWKTITALSVAKKLGKKKILFLTKKKAISSIMKDYSFFTDDFEILVTNYEAAHKIEDPKSFDIIVLDESHTLATFPKPSNKHKLVKKLFGTLDMILMTGTASPESYSQLFHQFFTKKNWPWEEHKNFYRWADVFVNKYEIRTSYGKATKYDKADYKKIMEGIWPMILTLTQEQAGFTTSVTEKFLTVKMTDKIYKMVAHLKKHKVIEAANEVILADTMVKEKSKIHQIYSWTIKTESWNYFILDSSKGKFIKREFEGKKIAIYYNFKAEKELLKKVFWDQITDDLDEFNSTDKNIMLQIVSWREGISLSAADFIVFYNISFSAVSYWQARDRLTTKERTENTVYWVFAEWGMWQDVYNAVSKKKKFTKNMYKEFAKRSM